MEKNKPNIFVVGGLLFGDEGKGTTVEYLAHKYKSKLVVRFSGGPQAAHHVVLENGTWHCFSQFGSASFEKDCKTLISKYMVISPTSLQAEEEILIKKGCKDIHDKLYIDKECFIVTPYHKMLNRVTETLLNNNKKGSTGQGVGVCFEDAYNSFPDHFPLGKEISETNLTETKYTCLQVKDTLLSNEELYDKLNKLKLEKLEQCKNLINTVKDDNDSVKELNKIMLDILKLNPNNKLCEFYLDFSKKYKTNFCDGANVIHDHLINCESIIFEGAQGMLLDRIYGFYPHITKSICSDLNVIALLDEVKLKYNYNYKEMNTYLKVGVLRCYSTRHGNGPFISYNNEVNNRIKEDHNGNSPWQGIFKLGNFDLVMAKYGVEIFKPDVLMITCIDKYLSYFVENEVEIITEYSVDNIINEDYKKYFNIVQDNEINTITSINKNEMKLHLNSAKITEMFGLVKPNLINIKNIKIDQSSFDINLVYGIRQKLIKENSETINLIIRFLSVLQFEIDVPIKLISFGATKFDKIDSF